MSTGFKYFKSTDPGAPVLTEARGAMINLLDWALDTGDAVNGWEKVFTGTQKAVYRPRVGSRCYLRVDDSAATGPANGYMAEVDAYESMTDVDTGVDAFPIPGQVSNLSFPKTYSTVVGVPRNYRGIKTAQFFLLFIESCHSATGNDFVFAGDIPSAVPSDTYNFWLRGANIGAPSQSYAYGCNSSSFLYPALNSINTLYRDLYVMRTHDGGQKSPYVTQYCAFSHGSGLNSGNTGIHPAEFPPNSGVILRAPILMGSQTATGAANRRLRGALPHLHLCFMTSSAETALYDTFTDTSTGVTKNFVMLQITNSANYPVLAMEVSDTWGMP